MPGLRGRPVTRIARVVAEAGFELPTYPRSNCAMVDFDPQFIYELDRDFARRRAAAKRE